MYLENVISHFADIADALAGVGIVKLGLKTRRVQNHGTVIQNRLVDHLAVVVDLEHFHLENNMKGDVNKKLKSRFCVGKIVFHEKLVVTADADDISCSDDIISQSFATFVEEM